MFKHVAVEFWLLVIIAFIAYRPARYIWDYIGYAPSRDFERRSPEELAWRTTRGLLINLVMIGALVALAIFIFTPAARRMAQAAIFWPIIISGGAVWIWSTVIHGFVNGHVQPLLKGVHTSFERASQPRRYWASIAWNAALGCLAVWIAFGVYRDMGRDQCHNYKNKYTAREVLDACNALIAAGGGDKASLMSARGSAHYELGDYARAKVDYARAVDIDPTASSYHYNLGLAEEQLNDRAAALAQYGKAIAADGENADAWFRRGGIHLDNARYDEAIADFSKVHELEPDNIWAIANRGIAYAWKKDKAKAAQDFAKVRADDPSNPVLLRGEALLAINDGRLNDALDHLNKAIGMDADDRWSIMQRAEIYRRLGDWGKMQDDDSRLDRLNAALWQRAQRHKETEW